MGQLKWRPREICTDLPLLTKGDVQILQYIVWDDSGKVFPPRRIEEKAVQKPKNASFQLPKLSDWKSPLTRGLDEVPLVTFPIRWGSLFGEVKNDQDRVREAVNTKKPLRPSVVSDTVPVSGSAPCVQEVQELSELKSPVDMWTRQQCRFKEREKLLGKLTEKLAILEMELKSKKQQASISGESSLILTLSLIQEHLSTYQKALFAEFLLKDLHAEGRIPRADASALVAEISSTRSTGYNEEEDSCSFIDVQHLADAYCKKGGLTVQLKSLAGANSIKAFKQRNEDKLRGALQRKCLLGVSSEVVALVGLVAVGSIVLVGAGVRHLEDDRHLASRLGDIARADVQLAAVHSEKQYLGMFVEILQEQHQDAFEEKLRVEAAARKKLQRDNAWLNDPYLELVEHLFKTFSEERDTHNRITLSDLPTFAMFLGFKLTHSQMCLTRQLYGLRMDLLEVLTWYTLLKRNMI